MKRRQAPKLPARTNAAIANDLHEADFACASDALVPLNLLRAVKARSPSGKAKVCKTFIGGSIPPRASNANY